MLSILSQYLFYSFFIILILFFSGIGLTLFFIPQNLKKYTLLISPITGFCYATLTGWYCYNLKFSGTDVYALFILIPPVFFLAAAFLKQRKHPDKSENILNKNIILPLIISGIIFLALSMPLFKHTNGLNSISIGNNDIVDHTAKSRFLKEFSPDEATGFLGQTNFIQKDIESNRFGSPFAIAFLSSLSSLQAYQLGNITTLIFYLLSIIIFYILAKESFQYNRFSASAVSFIYGLSPVMLYLIYNGFQAQVIAMPLLLCFFLLHFQLINNCSQLRHCYPYIPLIVLIHWGISITYAHMLPINYAVVFFYICIISINKKSFNILKYWLIFSGVVFLINGILSPHRTKAFIGNILMHAQIPAGWPMPYFTPGYMLGLTLNPHPSSIIQVILSVTLTAMIIYGLFKNYKDNRKVFILSASCLFFILSGYNYIYFFGKVKYLSNEYKSFKLLSTLLPLVLLSLLILFRDVSFSSQIRAKRVVSFLLLILILIISSNFCMLIQYTSNHHLFVSRAMTDLKSLETIPSIQSVNILRNKWWDILWQNTFLMKKKQYFEISTYDGRLASKLEGQWDLIDLSIIPVNNLQENYSKKFIPINSRYILIKPKKRFNVK
ncbi:MAG: hypothetical protein ABH872_04035 [Candidatus Omnitrophota bacterium]